MKRLAINRWVYMVVVVLVSIGAGVAQEVAVGFAQPNLARESWFALVSVGLALALPVLTYPFGLLGTLCAFPLLLSGIATVGEAHVIVSPIYALAGWFQWYVVFPRLFGGRLNSTASDQTMGQSA